MPVSHRLSPMAKTMMFLWVLTMIATPIVRWTVGEGALYFMINLGVLMQAAGVVTILLSGSGARSTMLVIVSILSLAWLVEYIGSSTGIPFGRYQYTNILQPQLGGVPMLVPLAWLMMLPPAWAIASLVIKSRTLSASLPVRLARAGVTALAFSAWDLFLDPQMVAWNFWVWKQPGVYFGIPLVNFLGWGMISFILSFFIFPTRLPDKPLLLVYAITWFLQSVGQVLFWELPGPGLFGFLGMGAMLFWVFLWRDK